LEVYNSGIAGRTPAYQHKKTFLPHPDKVTFELMQLSHPQEYPAQGAEDATHKMTTADYSWVTGRLENVNHCRRLHSGAATLYARGTPCYRAPELIRESHGVGTERKYTNAVDIWSLGCVLFELLFRKKAFKDDFSVHEYYAQYRKLGTRLEFPSNEGGNFTLYLNHPQGKDPQTNNRRCNV
jgi:serine/threonine protein kinase